MGIQPDTTTIHKISFDLCDVEIAKELILASRYRKALESRLDGPVEGWSSGASSLVATRMHGFAATVHTAFNDHRPLAISPDHIWLLIAQGFAMHVRANAEKMRHLFVEHEGKKILEIVRDDIRKGQENAPWAEAIAEFSQQIQDNLTTDVYRLMVPQFSTSTPIEKTAFEIVLMDAVQEYFELWFSLCGIPSITLEGSPDDWRMIREHTRKLGKFELEWWTKLLDPILSEFVRTAEGNINKPFWENFYKYRSQSSGPFIDGWLVKFFPYFERYTGSGKNMKKTYEVNPYLDKTPESEFDGFSTNMLTSGLSRVPFKWDYITVTYEMEYVAGFMGMTQDLESKAMRPEIGWAVQDVEAVKAFRATKEPTLPTDL